MTDETTETHTEIEAQIVVQMIARSLLTYVLSGRDSKRLNFRIAENYLLKNCNYFDKAIVFKFADVETNFWSNIPSFSNGALGFERLGA